MRRLLAPVLCLLFASTVLAGCGDDAKAKPHVSAKERAQRSFASCLEDAGFVEQEDADAEQQPPLPLFAYHDPFEDQIDDFGTWVKPEALVYAAKTKHDADQIAEVAIASSVQSIVAGATSGKGSDAPAVDQSGRAIFVGDRPVIQPVLACGKRLD